MVTSFELAEGTTKKQRKKAIHSRKIFELNITPEARVGPMIMLGARWVCEKHYIYKVMHLKNRQTYTPFTNSFYLIV